MGTESRVWGIGALILLALLISQFWWYPYLWLNSPVRVWVASMILIVLILALTGRGFRGKFWGVLISPANRYSLSLLQMVLWTIVLVAAVVAYAVWRTHAEMETMGFAIPPAVWALLGLSTASLVASPLIISQKNPTVAPLSPRQDNPRLLDLVAGEEKANEDTIDLSRVQMLLFTLVAVGAYAAALSAQMSGDCFRFEELSAAYKAMGNAEGVNKLAELIKSCKDIKLLETFPKFSEGLLAIIAISHAGYLTLKAVPKKPAPKK